MANENGQARCCDKCGGELGDDGFAVRLPDELGEEQAAPEAPLDVEGAFAAAVRQRNGGSASDSKAGGA